LLFGHFACFAYFATYVSLHIWRKFLISPRNSWIMHIGNGSPLSIRVEVGVEEGTGSRSSWRVVATELSCLRVMMMMMIYSAIQLSSCKCVF